MTSATVRAGWNFLCRRGSGTTCAAVDHPIAGRVGSHEVTTTLVDRPIQSAPGAV